MHTKKIFSLFAVVAIVGSLVVLVMSVMTMRQQLEDYSMEIIETESIGLGYALYEMEREVLINPATGKLKKEIPVEEFVDLDRVVRNVLAPMNIVKIKIFDTSGLIVYSTDQSIIGKVDTGNERLDDALSGGINSELESKDSVADMSFEKRIDVDVVETYLPMYDDQGKVIGAYETYRDVTPFRDKMAETITAHILILGGLMLALITGLLILVRRFIQ